MNFSKSHVGLLFVAAFVGCFGFHSSSALVTGNSRLRQEGTVELPQPNLWKRSVKMNATHPSLSDIAKRLLVVETRQVTYKVETSLQVQSETYLVD